MGSWHLSTAGSPRGLTPPIRKRRRHCWRSWTDNVAVIPLIKDYERNSAAFCDAASSRLFPFLVLCLLTGACSWVTLGSRDMAQSTTTITYWACKRSCEEDTHHDEGHDPCHLKGYSADCPTNRGSLPSAEGDSVRFLCPWDAD